MEKRNTIFLDIKKKDHVQVQIFWKDHLFKTFGKRKYGFSCSVTSNY